MGSVLIVVMIVCLGLVALTLVFGSTMIMAYRGADNSQAGQQADQAIEGAARYAEYLMTQVTRPGAMPDSTTFQSDSLPVGDATFWFIGEPTSTDPIDKPAFGLVDEASKLNLNTATFDMLMALPGMTSDLAISIIGWRTSVSGSATASAGSVTTTTSTVKSARFESVEELALVSGTDSSLLYGQDLNLNHVIDSNESDSNTTFSTGSTDNRISSGLLEYLTVFSREPNKSSDGSARINVTQLPVPPAAQSPALTTLLTNTFDSSRAREIETKLRTAGRFTSVLQFYIRSGMTEPEFEKIVPSLTAKTGDYVTGLVNVNTASATVLTCIPGIGSDKAGQLISARTAQATPPASLAWVVPILGEDGAIQAGPYLTMNSYQISADVAAVGHNGRGYRRTRFVIDNSTGTPRIIYRRNMTPLGWALGSDVREALAMKKETK